MLFHPNHILALEILIVEHGIQWPHTHRAFRKPEPPHCQRCFLSQVATLET